MDQNTLYWIADAYYQLNDLASAEKIYKEFVLQAPQSPLVPYALEALALRSRRRGRRATGKRPLRSTRRSFARGTSGARIWRSRSKWNWRRFITTREISRRPPKPGAAWSRSQPRPRCGPKRFSAKPMRSPRAVLPGGDQALENADPHVPRKPLVSGRPDADRKYPGGLGLWADAADTFSTLRQSYPNSEQAKEGAFQLVQCAFNQGNLNTAVKELLDFAKRYPDDARISKAADNLLSSLHQKKTPCPRPSRRSFELAPDPPEGPRFSGERRFALQRGQIRLGPEAV